MIELQPHIYYRTHLGENKASRPSWYSKELCLKSFVMSLDVMNSEIPTEFTLLIDGYLKPHDEWSNKIKSMAEKRGLIIEAKSAGNVETNINVIRKAAALPGNTTVVFAEDDYLWLAPALIELHSSLTQLPVHYSTPYDHPVRYQPEFVGGKDLAHWHNSIYITKNRHWRTQESTCMTFASTTQTLKEDLELFEIYKDNGKGRPEDRELFRNLQGLGKYADAINNKKVLIGPIPSLATHAHLPWLAPLINWEREAKSIFEHTLT